MERRAHQPPSPLVSSASATFTPGLSHACYISAPASAATDAHVAGGKGGLGARGGSGAGTTGGTEMEWDHPSGGHPTGAPGGHDWMTAFGIPGRSQL
ncbi:unnamed protein product [Laminaria digitata]